MILFYTFQGKNSIEKGKNLQGVYEVENRQRSVAPFAKRERPNGRSPLINYVICSFIPLVASCMHKPSENITISVVYTFLFSDYKQMTVCSVETVYLIHRFSSDSLCPPGKAFPFPRQLLQRSLLKIFCPACRLSYLPGHFGARGTAFISELLLFAACGGYTSLSSRVSSSSSDKLR